MPLVSSENACRFEPAFLRPWAEGQAEFETDFPMPPKTFPRTARLLRHADFERVYRQGRRHFSASMTFFYLFRGEESGTSVRPVPAGLRVGFTVGRALGGAVDRNRMKRRLREAVRLSFPERPPAADVVINPKKVLLRAEFKALLQEVERAFRVIEQKFSGSSASAKSPAQGAGSGADRAATTKAATTKAATKDRS